MNVEPGWYPDPDGSPLLRYWDGGVWTDHLHDPRDDIDDPESTFVHGGAVQLLPDAPEPFGPPAVAVGWPPATASAPNGDRADDDRDRRSPWLWILGGLAVAVVAVWGFVAIALLGGDDDDTDAGADTVTASADRNDAEEGDVVAASGDDRDVAVAPTPTPTPVPTPTPTPEPTPTPTPQPTPTPTVERSGRIYARVAFLRPVPSLEEDQIREFRPSDGIPVTIIGEHDEGWYRVEVRGSSGYMFGSLITPPPEGMAVVETFDDSDIVPLSSSGRRLNIDYASGDLALVSVPSGRYWEIILPDGGRAHVDPNTVRVVSSS